MEKTSLQVQFEKQMIHHISSLDASPECRAHIFEDFHKNAHEYYENLCDILYAISTRAVRAPIWMTHAGEIYASTHRKNDDDEFLLPSSEVPDFEGDLIPHLELILLCIYRVSSKYFTNKKCSDKAVTTS